MTTLRPTVGGHRAALLACALTMPAALDARARRGPRHRPRAAVPSQQLHASNRWNLNHGRQTASLAGRYDKGRLTPTLERVIDSDDAERAWVVAPGLFVHPARNLAPGAGAVLSPARRPVLAGGRVVVTASF